MGGSVHTKATLAACLALVTSSGASSASESGCARLPLADAAEHQGPRLRFERPGAPPSDVESGATIQARGGSRLQLIDIAPSASRANRVSLRAQGDVAIGTDGTLLAPRHSHWRFLDPDSLHPIGSIIVVVDGKDVACVDVE